MKKIFTLVIMVAALDSMACTINARTKGNGKTLYVQGVSISKKVQEALSVQCKIVSKPMSLEEQIMMERDAYEAKVARLKKPKK